MNCLRLKDTILGIWNGWAWWGGIALNLGHPNRSSSSCYIYRVFQLMMVAFLAVNRRKTLMRGRLRRRNLLYWELLIILSWESTNPSCWGAFLRLFKCPCDWLRAQTICNHTELLRSSPNSDFQTVVKPFLWLHIQHKHRCNTVFESNRKSRIQHCKLRLHFEWTKVH